MLWGGMNGLQPVSWSAVCLLSHLSHCDRSHASCSTPKTVKYNRVGWKKETSFTGDNLGNFSGSSFFSFCTLDLLMIFRTLPRTTGFHLRGCMIQRDRVLSGKGMEKLLWKGAFNEEALLSPKLLGSFIVLLLKRTCIVIISAFWGGKVQAAAAESLSPLSS